jgi:dTMP kinase
MLGMEVADDVRGRTFAFVQSLIRVVLVGVLAVAPLIAAAVGQHTFKFQNTQISYNGAAVTILFAGIIASLIGFVSYKQMKDRPNVSLWSDISNALKGELGSITGAPTAGLFLVALAAIPNLVLAVFITTILGAFSGICWVTGFTMLGMEVSDDVRGRTFAFVQSLIRVVLVGVLAVAPLIAAAVGQHTFKFQNTQISYNGAAVTILFAGIIASLIGLASYKQMKDRPNVSLWSDISNALKGELGSITGAPTAGIFIAFEGGEGIGKSTQSKLLKAWLEQEGETVVLSREPGGSDLGIEIRKILLSHSTGEISPRAEALLYAADRAHHVYSVIRPALALGEVVISDRYFDSSIAYQGAGRVLEPGEVARISRWATESLFPTLTIIIDLPPQIGLARLKSKDRLESQPIDFHERVRQEFIQLAALDPERYVIIDGNQSIEDTHATIISRVSQIQTLKRNAVEDKGNLLLRPIRAAGKAVKKTGTTATKAVKKSGTAVKAKTKKPVKK